VKSLIPKGLVWHLVRHPLDTTPVLVAAWRLRRQSWWRHAPFLPLPAPAYWEFRIATVSGSHGTVDPRAVVDAAKWSLRQGRGH
jgi:hypothetical protein